MYTRFMHIYILYIYKVYLALPFFLANDCHSQGRLPPRTAAEPSVTQRQSASSMQSRSMLKAKDS